jgi:hypothetical protein
MTTTDQKAFEPHSDDCKEFFDVLLYKNLETESNDCRSAFAIAPFSLSYESHTNLVSLLAYPVSLNAEQMERAKSHHRQLVDGSDPTYKKAPIEKLRNPTQRQLVDSFRSSLRQPTTS